MVAVGIIKVVHKKGAGTGKVTRLAQKVHESEMNNILFLSPPVFIN